MSGEYQELCDFINEQREAGFPLGVNPKWGWVMDEESGKLRIPKHRFDWKMVDEDLRAQVFTIEELEGQRELGKRYDEELLQRLLLRHVDDLKLIDMKLKIIRLTLESPLIYSQKCGYYSKCTEENERERGFRLAVEQKVKDMEISERERLKRELSDAFKIAQDDYLTQFKGDSLVYIEEQKRLALISATRGRMPSVL